MEAPETEGLRTKRIHFVSWKRQKVEQALTQLDSVCDSFIDQLIFEAVMDVARQSHGYPAALPIRQLIQINPILPDSPFRLEFDVPTVEGSRRPQECPVCHERCDAARFTFHLASKCFGGPKTVDVVLKYFETEAHSAPTTD
jgi:hypothetical protein